MKFKKTENRVPTRSQTILVIIVLLVIFLMVALNLLINVKNVKNEANNLYQQKWTLQQEMDRRYRICMEYVNVEGLCNPSKNKE